MELSDLLNEKEWRKCRGVDGATVEELVDAFSYFCTNYWFIRHPERGRIKFEMLDANRYVRSVFRRWLLHMCFG